MNWRILLYPFSLVYSAVAGLRNFLFTRKILKEHEFDFPVILVGNLSVGGTGKTPHVEYLIRLLRNKYRVATLSRGYGRRTKGCVIAGKGATAETIGDEPMQYYTRFSDIKVAVCEDRLTGINKLMQLSPHPQVIIMDDGFQHRKVKPGFRILLTPCHKLYSNDRLLPAGDLREPRRGASRADVVFVTKTPDSFSETDKSGVRKKLSLKENQKLFFSSLVYSDPVSLSGLASLTIDQMLHKHVVLFSGIADAQPLIDFTSRNSKSFIHIRFPDHHFYTSADLNRIIEKFNMFAGDDKIILTTEKDYLRLKGNEMINRFSGLPAYYLPITVQPDQQNDFDQMVLSFIKSKTINA